ncbi:MAG TPA: hypothetical protein VFG47_16125 [Geminicoccaceae bacterium]|nr:hypothetical protein [Geminicoccaceae bacterium]
MIPDQQEIVRSLFGAFRLARLDGRGMGYFNLSIEGFWRSFFAAAIVAPGYALLVAQKLATWPATVDPALAVLIETLAYVLSWIAFPVAAVFLTTMLGLSRNYVSLIVAANWAEVLQFGLFLAVMTVTLVFPGAVRGPVLALVIGAILVYEWFVARTALETTGGVAVGIVLVDLLLGIGINLTADRLIWAVSTPPA